MNTIIYQLDWIKQHRTELNTCARACARDCCACDSCGWFEVKRMHWMTIYANSIPYTKHFEVIFNELQLGNAFGGINKRLCLISTACGIKHSFLLSLNFFVNLCKFLCCFWWNAFEKLPLQVTKCRIWDLLTHLLYYTIPKKANRNHSVVKLNHSHSNGRRRLQTKWQPFSSTVINVNYNHLNV